jgi:DNA-binding GntR family transcriptional regulator
MTGQASTSLKQRVYDELRARIERGELKEGERVAELAVCDSLGVSRTPVREALIQLEADGYLEGMPRRGFRVRSFDEQSAREVFEMLGPLDGRAALLALPNMNGDDLADMGFLCESMELAIAGGLTARYYDLQHEFHQHYIDRCGNRRLVKALGELMSQLSSRSYQRDDPQALQNMRAANEEHRHILRLFEAGDGKALQDYIRDVHWSLDNVEFATW